ncbi:hypothetical protein [Egbenema bharatensis]|uniref:hypothetical protein n=1 Tax=Egbenema bharatensis TaxID=3463334 RepID=UPI003A8785AD
MNTMSIQEPTLPNPFEWGLSLHAAVILSREPEILADLERARLLPPLPPGYIPTIVEVLFDDVPYIRAENGVISYIRDCHPEYQPLFIEYRFDDEIAVFQVGGEYVINRIAGMAIALAAQGFLH